MKPFRMFIRSIRDAFRSVFRNFSLSLASITCITITLVIVALSILATLNVNNFAKLIEKDVTMVVYVKEDTPSENLDIIESKIKNTDNVLTCIKKDRNQVKLEMQESDPLFESIMAGWTDEENPLMDTFQVTVEDIKLIKDTVKKIEQIENIDYVDYGEKMVETLIHVFRVIEKVSIIAVVALIVVTVFLIINTIKITIFSRKREISIMRLVGASNTSIRFPFLIEGMVLGLLGSIIPILMVIFGYHKVYNHFNGYLFTPLIRLIEPTPFIYLVSLIVLVIGIIVGMLGSYRAVKKYLKV